MIGSLRLADLPFSGKLLVTAFLALIGVGYLIGVRNIFEHHSEADLQPGLTVDDLRRNYHGLEVESTSDARKHTPSIMEKMVRPGGPMRKFLEKGGEPAIRGLTAWLEGGSEEEAFARADLAEPGAPSAQRVIGMQCVRCHNSTDGEMADVPYAQSVMDEAEYGLVMALAAPPGGKPTPGTKTMQLAPIGRPELVQVTHAHIMAIPVFTLIVGGLFLFTGLPTKLKSVIAPLPMVVLCADFASWWLARSIEPFIYVIAAAGAVFGLAFGFQILSVAYSLWLGKRSGKSAG